MSINIIERAIVPYNATGSSVIFNNQYHMFAPVAGINKVGMAGYNDDFSISTSQIVSISDKFKASGLQYTDVSNLPTNVVYAKDGIKSPNVVFSGYEHAVQDPTPGETGDITVKGSLLTTYSNYTDTDNYSMNEILFADGRIWFRELNIVAGVVDALTEFKISYSKDEVDSYFRTKGDSYTITQINALLALKVNLAGAETITGKKTFSAGLSTSIAPTVGNDVVNKTYADSEVALKVALAGTETITGKKTFSAGLDTPVAPVAGADVVNKTYADSKVPKTAIQTRMSGTPLDSNVLSEKFVNTTYRTKADSWSKANLDAHIGALETRVGDEVLSASLPGNEFGQGTLSGIINTLGSHIDSLQLGFVPRTMRNIITPLRSKNPTDLSTTDSYDELIALSEVGFVPDIPVGHTMTLVDRLNAFVLADQGRTPNHTDAVVCVDIQAPDRGRLITYYYWDLGTGDEYEGVPAGWYVADVNMSPDNITNIGAFTKLLSKIPVSYEEDSTGTRVFAVNGSWKKYSAADLHAIYPTLEYLGLLNLWFIILAPDFDTMNTINNYEPGKSVALVDCAHGMGIDSAISIELLKKVKDVESGSLIQNIQYCKLDQFHVLSNGLVVLYADDPFDGEVVIKTGKAYYVSGATEMMAVPMSQVTGLELALDLKTDIADIIGDEATETVKSAEHAITANKYNQNDLTEGSIKSKFDSVDSAISGKQPTGSYATLDENSKVNEVAKSAETANKYNQNDLTEGSIKSKFDSVDSAISGKQPTGSYATLDENSKVNEVAKSADKVNKTLTLPNDKSFDGSVDVTFEKADLSLEKADVGLGSVDNTADSEKNVNSALNYKKVVGETVTFWPIAASLEAAHSHSQAAHAPSDAEANVQSDWTQTDSTSDAYIKNKPAVMTPYDKVIFNQDEFEDMIEDSDWLDAKSVALVGEFTLSKASGIQIPQNVKQIHGFNGAKITVTDFVFDSSTAKGGLWYETAPTTLDYSIRDLEVSCTAASGYSGHGFYNCHNLSNCTGTGTGTGGRGFLHCNNLSNCTGTGMGIGTTSNASGFSDCTNLTNCTGTATGYVFVSGFRDCTNVRNCAGTATAYSTYGYGFEDCANLTNCTGTGTGRENGSGFEGCDYITNCEGTGTGTGTNYHGYGFSYCNYITNCTGTGTGGNTGVGFFACAYITNCVGKGIDTTDHSSGCGFYGITCASNCKDGGSNTVMWGGSNGDIDIDTCRRTSVEVTTAELAALNT